jgi:thiosulfate/3-mercaptopyruvate sulfurtransferase
MNGSNETTPAASNNYPSKGIMISVSDAARSDAIIEPSKEEPETMMTIQDSIAIPAEMLIQNGSLKKAEDMAKVLGDAGVSSEDSVAIYSTNPYDSALMFWALSYLGQKEVAIMNGGVGEWQAAGFDVGRHAMDRPREEYTPALRTQLLAGRNDAFSVGVHLIDCRPFLRFSENRIEGAFSIPSERVIERDRIAPKDALNRSFDAIPKKGPIVVFSEDPRDAAVVWTALQLMGIKSAIYIMEGNAKEQGVGIKNQSFDSSIGSVGRFKKLG